MICSKCGTKNNQEANFCNKCGKNLGDVNNKNYINFKDFFKVILQDAKGMIYKPIDTAKKFIKEENYLNSLIYISLNIFVIAFFILAIINIFYKTINIPFGYETINSMYDGFYNQITIPYFKLFLISIIKRHIYQ